MNRRRNYNRGIKLIEDLIKKTENILRRSNYHMVNQGSTPVEPLKNYCLKNIETLNKLNRKALDIPDTLYDYAKRRMFDIYFELQEYRGTERQILNNNRENIRITELISGNKKQLIIPLIAFKRTSIEKDNTLGVDKLNPKDTKL